MGEGRGEGERALKSEVVFARVLSTPIHKYGYVRCAAFGFGLVATREHTRQRSVTEEQQRPKPNAAQPSGRQVFLRQTSLLAPYRPLTGMRVARASSGTKIPCRERNRIYELEYLVWCPRNSYTFAAMDFGRRLG